MRNSKIDDDFREYPKFIIHLNEEAIEIKDTQKEIFICPEKFFTGYSLIRAHKKHFNVNCFDLHERLRKYPLDMFYNNITDQKDLGMLLEQMNEPNLEDSDESFI